MYYFTRNYLFLLIICYLDEWPIALRTGRSVSRRRVFLFFAGRHVHHCDAAVAGIPRPSTWGAPGLRSGYCPQSRVRVRRPAIVGQPAPYHDGHHSDQQRQDDVNLRVSYCKPKKKLFTTRSIILLNWGRWLIKSLQKGEFSNKFSSKFLTVKVRALKLLNWSIIASQGD